MTAQDIRLQANFTACVAEYDAPTTTWTRQAFYPGSSWKLGTAEFSPVAAPGLLLPVMWTMNTIDLAGLELAKETFFPVGTSIQDPGLYVNGSAGATPALHVIDLITDKLIDPLLAVQMTNGVSALTGTNYGMLGDGNDATTILMGSYRFKTGNTNLTYPQMMRTEQASIFSSGEPTAASKLYCYRIIVPLTNGAGSTSIQIPAARFYLTGVRDEEPDLEYMMRLKRSYELDQTQS